MKAAITIAMILLTLPANAAYVILPACTIFIDEQTGFIELASPLDESPCPPADWVNPYELHFAVDYRPNNSTTSQPISD